MAEYFKPAAIPAVENSVAAIHATSMADLRARFAAELKVARQQAGMTQEALAAATNTSVDFLSKLERGLNSPSLETLAALVRALHLDPVRLLVPDDPQRSLTPARRELEIRAARLAHELDDDELLALLDIGNAIARLRPRLANKKKPAPVTTRPAKPLSRNRLSGMLTP